MKRATAFLLVLMVCLSLCACNKSQDLQPIQDYHQPSNHIPVQTEPKEFTSYDAYLVAKDYVETRANAELSDKVSKANSIDYFKIASYDNKGEKDNYYNFTFYGTFAARDKYGDLIDFYKYSWKVKVNKNDPDRVYLDNMNEYGMISVQKD